MSRSRRRFNVNVESEKYSYQVSTTPYAGQTNERIFPRREYYNNERVCVYKSVWECIHGFENITGLKPKIESFELWRDDWSSTCIIRLRGYIRMLCVCILV